jgi:DNA-binding GntR family transcriptional regulator
VPVSRRGNSASKGRLPSERALSEHFSTTRITLREALSQLEAEGLIYREVRRGWFISPPRMIYNPLQRSHFHAMAKDQGRSAQTEVIDARQCAASAACVKNCSCRPTAR